jgi:drug/metabolite transporter (DMT)-like permease
VSERTGLWLYAAGFTLLIAAGVIFTVASRGYLNSIRLLWLSAGLSVGAIVVSVLGLTLARRG